MRRLSWPNHGQMLLLPLVTSEVDQSLDISYSLASTLPRFLVCVCKTLPRSKNQASYPVTASTSTERPEKRGADAAPLFDPRRWAPCSMDFNRPFEEPRAWRMQQHPHLVGCSPQSPLLLYPR